MTMLFWKSHDTALHIAAVDTLIQQDCLYLEVHNIVATATNRSRICWVSVLRFKIPSRDAFVSRSFENQCHWIERTAIATILPVAFDICARFPKRFVITPPKYPGSRLLEGPLPDPARTLLARSARSDAFSKQARIFEKAKHSYLSRVASRRSLSRAWGNNKVFAP